MDWFKLWPSAYLNVINRISDGSLRGPFSLLIFHCLNDGSLPDDDDEIAFLTGMPIKQVTPLRPFLTRLARSEDGRLYLTVTEDTIRERQEFAAKKAKAGEAGGKQKQANKEVVSQVLAKASSASEKIAKPSNGLLCLPTPSQTNRQTDIQTNTQGEVRPARPIEIETGNQRLDKITAMVIAGCGITFLSEQIERQVIVAVGAINQTGESLDCIKAFFDSRVKCQSLNYVVANFMQWVGSEKRLTESAATAPEYSCARCQDRGIIASPNGGRAIDCPNCSAQEASDARRTA